MASWEDITSGKLSGTWIFTYMDKKGHTWTEEVSGNSYAAASAHANRVAMRTGARVVSFTKK